jgi:hypothetical protein
VVFASPQKAIFAVEKYRKTLEKVVARKGIETRFRENLVELRPDAREAVFENLDTHEWSVIGYDMIHVTPPMAAPEVVRRSPLANDHGWCEVDKHTLRHLRYPDVFALGDAAGLPTSKTGGSQPARVDPGPHTRRLLRRLHVVSAGHGIRSHGARRVRLRQQAAGVVSLRPVEGAVQHVAAEDPGAAAALLVRHAPREGVSRSPAACSAAAEPERAAMAHPAGAVSRRGWSWRS